MTSVKLHGLYVVLEGAEGVGKTTQIQLLADRLQKQGYIVKQFREPDSQTNITARAIRKITQNPFYPLNSRTEVLLYNAARSQSLETIKHARQQGIVCLCDRNYLTTLSVQYYGRGDIQNYDAINDIIAFAVDDMEPDITIILDAPVNTLKNRTEKRGKGERFDNLDLAFLERVRAGYLIEAKKRNYPVVTSINDPQKINDSIWDILHGKNTKQYSPANISAPPLLAATAAAVSSTKVTSDEVTQPKPQSQTKVENIVTNTTGSVYAFTNALEPAKIANTIAANLHKSGSLRSCIANDNLPTVTNEFTKQTQSYYFVIENASRILVNILRNGNLPNYYEQIPSNFHNENKHNYYIPINLSAKAKKQYCQALDEIFVKYGQMLNQLTDYIRKPTNVLKASQNNSWLKNTKAEARRALQDVLPVAATTSIAININQPNLVTLITQLISNELPEAKTTGKRLLNEACKIIPGIDKNIESPNNPKSLIAYNVTNFNKVNSLAEAVNLNYSNDTDTVRLTDVWPRNELDIVADILYEHSNLSLTEIRNQIERWPYKQKLAVLEAYIGDRQKPDQKPGRALEKAKYSWDVISSYTAFCEFQRRCVNINVEWQALSPRYGYDIPALIEQAGIAEPYLDCFDISIELYNHLQQQGYEQAAQYSTLLGHKIRWQATYNGLDWLNKLMQGTDNPEYKNIGSVMTQQLQKTHPIMFGRLKTH